MAIRYREKYGTWQVYYRDPATKKIVSRSYKTEDEAKKEDARVRYLLQYEPERLPKPAPKPSKAKVGEIYDNNQEEKPQTVGSLYLSYLREKQYSKDVLARQYSHLKKFLERFGNVPLSEVNEELLQEICDAIKSSGLHQTTQHTRLAFVRTLIYYGVRKKMIAPVRFPQIPAAAPDALVPPTSEELAAIYAAAAEHIKRVIVIGAYCGARVGPCELLQLTWADVDLSRKILRVHGSKKNKKSPYREVPIRESLVPLFRQWQAEDLAQGTQHLISYKGKPVKQIFHGWQNALRRAGITRRIRPYDLRHAFGTELVAAGVDIGTVAKLMGHSSPTMLLTHYQYVMDKQKREAVEHLPDLCMSQSDLDIQGTPESPRQ